MTTRNSYRYTLLLTFVLTLISVFKTNADDSNSNSTGLFPNANLTVPMFTEDVSFRQNFCDVQSKVHNGEVDLRTAFEGRNLHVSLTVDPNYVFRHEDGSINQENPGLLVKLMDEIALRGKFSWRDTFAWEDYNALPDDKDWTDLLLWSINTYDLSANWWFDTLARTSLGASFPKGWFDGSLIIVTTKNDESSNEFYFNLFWVTPFARSVWISIIVTLVVSAIVSALVEGKTRRKEGILIPFEDSIFSTILSYLHQSFLVVTGHLDLIPNTHAGQIVSLSMSFFALLLLSMYTASLASLLVVERTAVNTLNDVVQARQSICVWGGTSVEEEILRSYEYATLVRKVGDDGVLKGVRDGECNFGVVAISSYELFQGKQEVNAYCNLIRVGRNFKTYENGLAVKADAGTLCTSLVRDMLSVHMKDLWDEGYIDELWSDLYREKHDVEDPTCFDYSTSGSSSTMDLNSLGTIFILHGGFLVIAILVYLIERRIRKINKLKGITSKDEVLRQSQFHRRSFGFHSDELAQTDKVDILESKVLGIENDMEEVKSTMNEILKRVVQIQQQQSACNPSDKPNYATQETFGTATSSIQYDLSGSNTHEERFDDDNFSYDTNVVFR